MSWLARHRGFLTLVAVAAAAALLWAQLGAVTRERDALRVRLARIAR